MQTRWRIKLFNSWATLDATLTGVLIGGSIRGEMYMFPDYAPAIKKGGSYILALFIVYVIILSRPFSVSLLGRLRWKFLQVDDRVEIVNSLGRIQAIVRAIQDAGQLVECTVVRMKTASGLSEISRVEPPVFWSALEITRIHNEEDFKHD